MNMDIDAAESFKQEVIHGIAMCFATSFAVCKPDSTPPLGHTSELGADGFPGVGIIANGGGDPKVEIHISHALHKNSLKPVLDAIGEDRYRLKVTGNACAQIGRYCGRQRPLKIGVSISRSEELAQAGTLGCFVSRSGDTGILALTCAHVVLNRNQGKIGQDLILQPSTLDGGEVDDDQIGILHDYIPLKVDGEGSVDPSTPSTDAALIRVEAGIPLTHLGHIDDAVSPLKGYWDSLRIKTESGSRRAVYKLGRQTGLTAGTIETIGFQGIVNYKGAMQCTYPDMFTIEGSGSKPFSAPGDSGALIFNEEGYAVALLVGGTPKGGRNDTGITYALPLDHILATLELDLVVD